MLSLDTQSLVKSLMMLFMNLWLQLSRGEFNLLPPYLLRSQRVNSTFLIKCVPWTPWKNNICLPQRKCCDIYLPSLTWKAHAFAEIRTRDPDYNHDNQIKHWRSKPLGYGSVCSEFPFLINRFKWLD